MISDELVADSSFPHHLIMLLLIISQISFKWN